MSRAALVTAVGALVLLTGARGDYVGTATCGTCHPRELAAWQQTAHARSSASLPARPPARCLACHGTGDAPAGRAYFAEVGCEACHGPGGHYAADDLMRDLPLARALGRRDTRTPTARAAICRQCHVGVGTRLAPLDLSARAH